MLPQHANLHPPSPQKTHTDTHISKHTIIYEIYKLQGARRGVSQGALRGIAQRILFVNVTDSKQ